MSLFPTKYNDHLYLIFRIGIGLLFFLLGVQKIFGLWGMPGGPAPFATLVWYAGAGEIFIGFSLITGVLVRLASFFGVIEMIIAYILGHAMALGWNPMVNMGQPALLYLLAFLMTFALGAGKASLEQLVFKKEFF